jgi:hypothetical protein
MDGELEVELFIEGIKKYSEIWDITCEQYRDKSKKRAAWINVCNIFHNNFKEKTDEEKNNIGKYDYMYFLHQSLCFYRILHYSTGEVYFYK